jgi:hypothetical protein
MTSGGKVDAPIDRHPVDRVRMAVRTGGRDSVTHYRVIERYRRHTWVRVTLETGRTHQIRLHLSHAGYPLVGDAVYGGRLVLPKGASPAFIERLRSFRRQALHAAKLAFPHPGDAAASRSSRRPRILALPRRAQARPQSGRGLMAAPKFLWPNWPAPAGVHAAMTTREGGVSRVRSPASISQAMWTKTPPCPRTGDGFARRSSFRRNLPGSSRCTASASSLPEFPRSCRCRRGVYARQRLCRARRRLPARVLAGRDGRRVGVAHGMARSCRGRRRRRSRLKCEPGELFAWLGSSIGPAAFEVGGEVRDAFMAHDAARDCFPAGREGRWFADLPALARRRSPRRRRAVAASSAPIRSGALLFLPP